ncbi:MAG: NAD-dependent epimerase/dehydratase family protein [Akkermansia sp.]|nr:NAD-dependent epimerase/dehydratase family protein [Akkermansia sp.]
MSPAEQCVWVIGAGFLGSELARVCRNAGVTVLTIDPVAPADVPGAACHAAVVQEAAMRGAPAVCFCCMATAGGNASAYDACYRRTVQCLVREVPHARVVFCSSTSVYGVTDGREVTEETRPEAAGSRATVLLQTEQAVLAAGGVVARLAALYGTGRCELVRRHMAGEPCLPGRATRTLNYVHVADAAAALWLLQHAPSGVYNVCGSSFTKAEAYAHLTRETGVPQALSSAPESRRGGTDMRVNADKLRALGWCPRRFFRD